MKKIISSMICIVTLTSAISMFAMDKLTQAERAKVITAAKAAKGDEQKFQAAIKSIPKAAGITLADALPGGAAVVTPPTPVQPVVPTLKNANAQGAFKQALDALDPVAREAGTDKATIMNAISEKAKALAS